jgi:short-subunit dehydrogenase involved in D-alanine esterification of teichoic acids
MENNYIIIYGGSSLISKKLLEILSKDFNQFIIFCRDKNIVQQYISEKRLVG